MFQNKVGARTGVVEDCIALSNGLQVCSHFQAEINCHQCCPRMGKSLKDQPATTVLVQPG